jgi:hypothetical protein
MLGERRWAMAIVLDHTIVPVKNQDEAVTL